MPSDLGNFYPMDEREEITFSQDYTERDIELMRDMWRRYATPKFANLFDAEAAEADGPETNALHNEAAQEEAWMEQLTKDLIEATKQKGGTLTRAEAESLAKEFNENNAQKS